MTNDEQRLESSKIIRDALIDCIGKLRAEQNKNYAGKWDGYIDDIVDGMMDAISEITGALQKGVEQSGEEYERLTGHEMGVCLGRV